MKKGLENILSSTSCPSPEKFDAYLQGNLSTSEIHAFESHLNECEFCQEALDGFESTPIPSVKAATASIHQKTDRSASSGFSIQYLAVAATVVITLFMGALFLINDTANEQSITLKQEKLETESAAETTEREALETASDPKQEATNEIPMEEEVSDEPITTQQEQLPPPKPTVEEVEIIEVNDAEYEQIALADDNADADAGSGDTYEQDAEERSQAAGSTAPVMGNNNTNAIVSTDLMEEDNDTEVFEMEEEAMESTYAVTETSKKSKSSAKLPSPIVSSFNSDEMLSFASQQINSSFQNENKEKDDDNYSSNRQISYHNTEELREQLAWLQEGKYSESLSKVNFLITKDVWTHEEMSTLQWFKAIAKLELGQSAKEELKDLKRTKNPYQDEAKKLYNQLY